MKTTHFRFDLGIRDLLPEWRFLLGKLYWREDFFAGLTLALVAVPLSLAIALASGVEPVVGLITAIIAGVVCAIFGGNPISVSGPTATMAIIVGLAVERYGMSGLFFIGIICGLLQLLTGILKLGRFIRLMPIAVIEGCTAGIGAIIFISQLPRALGLPAPSESQAIDVLIHIGTLFEDSEGISVAVALGVIFLLWITPKISSKLPSPLIAILIPSVLAAYFFEGQLLIIGEIPKSLPMPSFPGWPSGIAWAELFGTALLIYALASLETLLSSTVVDKLVKGQHSDLDQELIGQGIGNFFAAIFGGMPVTAVIVRSATNVMAGGKTRRSAIIHSILILMTVLFLSTFISQIPIAALAGLLLFISARMMNPEKLINLWKLSRSDGTIYGITFLLIVFVDLLEGIQWGLVAALAVVALQLGRTRVQFYGSNVGASGPYRFELQGPLTFLSSLKIDELKGHVVNLESGRGIAIDMKAVTEIDGSGAEMFLELVHELLDRGLRVAVLSLPEKEKEFLISADSSGRIARLIASTEQQLLQILEGSLPSDPVLRLEKGLNRFLTEERPRYKELFGKLAHGQSPHTLFITCSDSRIQPNLMTSTDPGELFIVRNVGNMIPRCSDGEVFAEAAAVDFAVGVLGVREIVVCGHSGCGAMKALHGREELPADLKNLEAWRKATVQSDIYHRLPAEMPFDEVARINTLHQLDNLRSYPLVQEREKSGELKLHAWFFEIVDGEVEIWSSERKKYLKHSDSLMAQST
jgi:carbonic anhydrase